MRNVSYKFLVLTEFPEIDESLCAIKIMAQYKNIKKNKPKLVNFIDDWWKSLYLALTAKSKPDIKVSKHNTTFEYKPNTYVYEPECNHTGAEPVEVGGTKCLYLTGTRHVSFKTPLHDIDYVIALQPTLLSNMTGKWQNVLSVNMEDMGGISDLAASTIPIIADLLKQGNKLLMYCIGSHGRTGSMLAMLIAHMEPEIEDPVAEARKRHCKKSVESFSQIEGIFKFAKKPIPPIYTPLKTKPAINNQQVWQGHLF